ncbi:MAG: 2-C-methyl-D-erythritol 4-phosphate cytidylyltransferase [Acidobacteria bacterium]|nr:2-C-methyl-D-erythritol 4-phosphate cytidylyltransferase [Acidobacteriota bacterium]
MQVTAIIAAGGRGQRFGGGQPKQLLSVGGRPILERSVAAFLAHPAVSEIVVALPASLVEHPPDYLRQTVKPMHLVGGGARRQDSIANAFRAAAASSDVIVIHDAARPFASADLIARTIAAAAESGAALAAVASRDTVKRASSPAADASPAEAGRHRTVIETLPRETIFLAQTPQAFRRDVLQAALALGEREGLDATDEAALAERAGHPVRLVDGEATNIKITTPEDLAIAEAIAAQLRIEDREVRSSESPVDSQSAVRNPQSALRTGRAGTGYDLHRLVEGRPLILGGITIPSLRGALGHSDADVVCHAVTDAILGAACLGDIGRHFPDSDPRWKGASSLDLLSRASALVAAEGLEVGNVDVTVILEAPKITHHVDAMRAAVARAIGIDASRVSIKGKTNEGVDAVGRGEAIAAHAVALIRIKN